MSEKEKIEKRRFGTFGKIIVAMALLAVVGLCVFATGYKTIGVMMTRVAIAVDVGAVMVMGLKWLRIRRWNKEMEK